MARFAFLHGVTGRSIGSDRAVVGVLSAPIDRAAER